MLQDKKELARLQHNAHLEAIESLKRRLEAAEFLLMDPRWEDKDFARESILTISSLLAEKVLSQ